MIKSALAYEKYKCDSSELQSRLDELSQKNKAGMLNSKEEAELTGILELDRIFTLLNAKIIAES